MGLSAFQNNVVSGGLSTADVNFTFEKNKYPDHEPNFTVGAAVTSETEMEYTIDVPAQGDQTFNSLLMKLGTRTAEGEFVMVKDVLVTANSSDPVDPDTPWRQAKNNMGLMLKEGLLKENIDGEALKWAYNKMNRRKEERKILMVISDGAPVDDSTLSTNTSDYLESNLKKTVKWIENKTNIELLAIGIGHDVTRYYDQAVKITDVQDLGDVMINQLTDLFVEKNRKTIH